jgi:hypothetical protein
MDEPAGAGWRLVLALRRWLISKSHTLLTKVAQPTTGTNIQRKTGSICRQSKPFA